MPVCIALSRLEHGRDLPLPRPQTRGAAGADLVAALAPGEVAVLPPGGRRSIPCGFRMALPEGFEAQVRPRSGLAARHGVTVLNSPGTIDCDYRGEVMVVLINHGEADFVIHRGDRIAQMVVAPVSPVEFLVMETLDETERGQAGFGSTGLGSQ